MSRSISADPDLSVRGGALHIVSGVEAVRQRAVQRLRLVRGEAILRQDAGVPYLSEVFVRPPFLAVAAITAELLRVTDIDRVADVSADLQPSRQMLIRARVYTTSGESTPIDTVL